MYSYLRKKKTNYITYKYDESLKKTDHFHFFLLKFENIFESTIMRFETYKAPNEKIHCDESKNYWIIKYLTNEDWSLFVNL